jgi:hypothetical protein
MGQELEKVAVELSLPQSRQILRHIYRWQPHNIAGASQSFDIVTAMFFYNMRDGSCRRCG